MISVYSFTQNSLWFYFPFYTSFLKVKYIVLIGKNSFLLLILKYVIQSINSSLVNNFFHIICNCIILTASCYFIGRRKAQVRLVESVGSSLNHGDSYVLVTPTQIFCWHGEFSNVIERVKVILFFIMTLTNYNLL